MVRVNNPEIYYISIFIMIFSISFLLHPTRDLPFRIFSALVPSFVGLLGAEAAIKDTREIKTGVNESLVVFITIIHLFTATFFMIVLGYFFPVSAKSSWFFPTIFTFYISIVFITVIVLTIRAKKKIIKATA